MEGIKNLNLNVDVTVFAPDDSSRQKLSSKIFRGRICNKDSDSGIVITVEKGGGADLLVVGNPIFLFLAHDLGVYIYSARISSKNIEEGNIIVYCNRLREIRNLQRRKSVRVNVNIPVRYTLESDQAREQYGIIGDISVDGLLLGTPASIPVGTKLDLTLQLDNVGMVFVSGNVVRNFDKEGIYFTGISFSDSDRQTKDDMARFIMAEQMRQKRLGLQIFKAFIFNATVQVEAPTEISIIQYKNLDISALRGKKSNGTVREIGINGLSVETALKLPVGAKLEFPVDLPELGYYVIQATVRQVSMHRDKFIIEAEYVSAYEQVRDCILGRLAGDFGL